MHRQVSAWVIATHDSDAVKRTGMINVRSARLTGGLNLG